MEARANGWSKPPAAGKVNGVWTGGGCYCVIRSFSSGWLWMVDRSASSSE